MKRSRPVARLAAVLVVAVALAGCGSDTNAGSDVAAGTPRANQSPVHVPCGGNHSLRAEGSTSQLNAMVYFDVAWARACLGKTIDYNPTGSGAGIARFIANLIDFAGSSATLTAEQSQKAQQRCGGTPAWHLPLVFGPVALIYNLGDTFHGQLVVSATVLAEIFRGHITSWNDPAIVALNGTAKLPTMKISPIYRSDSSGTTDNFQTYLANAAPQLWTLKAGTEFHGGAGEGAALSSGVVHAVQVTPGAISYVEPSPAARAGLPFARLDNGSGATSLNDENVRQAIGVAKLGEGNDLIFDLKSVYTTTNAAAYPLIMATYEIVCSKGYDRNTAAAVKSFLTVAAGQGQRSLSDIGYVPLPPRLQMRVQAAIDAIE